MRNNTFVVAIIAVCLTLGLNTCSRFSKQAALEQQRIQLERENDQLKRDLGLKP